MEQKRQLREINNFTPGLPQFSCILANKDCPLHCKMCFDWKNPQDNLKNKMVNFEKYIKGLAEFINYPLEINILGGEPLMEDCIFDLIKLISDYGFISIISTNGYLIDENMAKRIMESPLSGLAISLESLNGKVHDYYRGKKGVADRVFEALKLLEKHKKSKGPIIDILTIIMEKNLDDIVDLVKWVDRNDFIIHISFLVLLNSIVRPGGPDWFKKEAFKDIWPSDAKKVSQLIDQLVAMKKSGSKIFNPSSQFAEFKQYYQDPVESFYNTSYSIKDSILDMEADGELYLGGYRLGNINDEMSLKEMWYSKQANEIRKRIAIYGLNITRTNLINFLCVFPADDNVGQISQRGFFLQRQGKYDLALEQFKKAAEMAPKNAKAHLGVAYNYLKLKNYRAAVYEYEKVLKLDTSLYGEFKFDYDLARKTVSKDITDND